MADSSILPMATRDDALELIGGKGRSLAKMSTAGFDVPTGFHLTADAYRAFVAENNLQEQRLLRWRSPCWTMTGSPLNLPRRLFEG